MALREKRRLSIFVVHVHKECDTGRIAWFSLRCCSAGWFITTVNVCFPDIGDCVDDRDTFGIGVHRLSMPKCEPIACPTPPCSDAKIADFLYKPFDKEELSVCPGKDSPIFQSTGFTSLKPLVQAAPSRRQSVVCLYNVHRVSDDPSVSAGTGVFSVDGLCPPLDHPSCNIFDRSFGIEFQTPQRSFVQGILHFEYASCFQIERNIRHGLSHPTNFTLLDCGVPASTSC